MIKIPHTALKPVTDRQLHLPQVTSKALLLLKFFPLKVSTWLLTQRKFIELGKKSWRKCRMMKRIIHSKIISRLS